MAELPVGNIVKSGCHVAPPPEVIAAYDAPFLTAFSDRDPITRGADRVLQRLIPGAAGRAHPTVEGAGHFLQEDRGEELARIVIEFARGA